MLNLYNGHEYSEIIRILSKIGFKSISIEMNFIILKRNCLMNNEIFAEIVLQK